MKLRISNATARLRQWRTCLGDGGSPHGRPIGRESEKLTKWDADTPPFRRKAVKSPLALLFLLLLPGVSAAAQTTIRAIEVEGNQRVEKDAILDRISTKVGDDFSAATLDADLKAIYALGYFKDIRIDVAPAEDGLTVIFHVTEKPSIGKITIRGNEAIETDKIWEEGLAVKENAILDIAKVVESVQKIEQLYTDEGYFIAEAAYDIEPLDENQVEVTFTIEENEKVLVREVVILGNEHFSDDELKRYMETREGNPLSWMSEAGKYKAEAFETDMRRIEFFYYEHGFINCKVEEPVVTLSSDKRSISVRFRVDEGKPYRVGAVDITGDLIFDKADLMKHLVLRKGDLFVRSQFQRDNEFIAAKYQNKGFAFANVNLKTKVHPENLTIDLTYDIQKGHLVYIEEITIVGNYKTHDRIIRRELAIREGEVLSGPAIALSRQRLLRLGFFSNVTFKQQVGSASNKMRIVVEVEETVTGNLLIGAGFSSVDRFVAQAQISQRNFLGRGYQYQLDAQLGQQRKDFSVAFANPRLFDSRWSFSGSITNTQRQFPDFLRKDRGFAAGIGYRIGEYWSLSGGYNLSNTFLTNFTSETFRNFLFNQEGETLISSLFLRLSRNTLNHPFIPTRGTRTRIRIRKAGDFLGGDLTFTEYTAKNDTYLPLFWNTVLLIRGDIRYGHAPPGQEFPLQQRYFLGGLQTIRGFAFRSIGPVAQSISPLRPGDPASLTQEREFVIGGNKMLLTNIEWQFPIIDPAGIRGVVFFDAGNAFDDGDLIDLRELRMSWGFGFRWFSPVGPLRFEWGFPIDRRPGERSTVFEFGVGTIF